MHVYAWRNKKCDVLSMEYNGLLLLLCACKNKLEYRRSGNFRRVLIFVGSSQRRNLKTRNFFNVA